MTVKERVENGAALLDREQPGWESKIDLDTLNIRLSDLCVTGQVGWGDHLSHDESRSHGFFKESEDWDVLTKTWRELILDRRA